MVYLLLGLCYSLPKCEGVVQLQYVENKKAAKPLFLNV